MAVTSFNNKVATITGAGSGMGRVLAEALAGRNCHVAISDIDPIALMETQERVQTGAGNRSPQFLQRLTTTSQMTSPVPGLHFHKPRR